MLVWKKEFWDLQGKMRGGASRVQRVGRKSRNLGGGGAGERITHNNGKGEAKALEFSL